MLVLVPALLACLAITSALPTQQKLTDNFIQAVTSLDFTAASHLYDAIRNNGQIDATAFTLAAAIKQVIKSKEFKQLADDSKHQLENLRQQIPTSVRNAVFADTVCILNADNFQYLYSPNDDYIYSPDSRNVFLWRLGGAVPGSNWTLEATLTPGDWKIINENGEYLFADSGHYYLNRRRVFTYTPTEWLGFSTNVWRFIPLGNQVILQNTWYSAGAEGKEYLYAPSNVYNYDANRGRVFTWDSVWTPGDLSNIWHVAAC